MMKTLKTKLSYLFLFFLLACSPITSRVSTPTAELQPSATVDPTPTSTTIPTPAPNILELTSAGELPLPAYKQECINILPTSTRKLQDFSATGVAVFSDFSDGQIILYDLKNGEKNAVPKVAALDLLTVSPDHKWLFYLTRIDGLSTFVLSNSAGEIVNTIPWSLIIENNYNYAQDAYEWSGNDSVRFWMRKSNTDDKLIVLLLDPFTKKTMILESDFDGLQSPVVKPGSGVGPADEYLDWGIDPLSTILFQVQGTNIAYSSDKKLAFFPHKDGYDVLYDLENSEELARINIPKWGELPKWSTTGEYLSIIASPPNTSQDSLKKDLYLLSRDGKTLKRLTYLSEQFDRVSIKHYAWSPDGTKIAFRVNTNVPISEEEVIPYELAVVDITNGNITNYCIPYYTYLDSRREIALLLTEPIWSPDSRQLLVPNRTPAKVPTLYHGFDVRTVLLNLSKVSAVEILDSVRIHGWMTNDQ